MPPYYTIAHMNPKAAAVVSKTPPGASKMSKNHESIRFYVSPNVPGLFRGRRFSFWFENVALFQAVGAFRKTR